MPIRKNRPVEQPVPARVLILLLLTICVVLSITAGFYHQRWQNQIRANKRLEKRLGKVTSSPTSTPALDQPVRTQ